MTIKDRFTDIGDRFSKDQILDSLGLQEKRTNTDYLVPALGIFGAGLAVGAVLGLLFAPKSGRDIRTDIRHRFDDMRSHKGHALTEGSQQTPMTTSTKATNPYAESSTEM